MNKQHQSMVQEQLRKRGIQDENVLLVMAAVPRHQFVAAAYQELAYVDGPVPIGYDQTISQPYIVAFMTASLKLAPHHKVLEIGTGCGYQTAVLSCLVKKVVSLERIPELAAAAQKRLQNLGYNNIDIITGNGCQGYAAAAPYDRIIVTAAAKGIPSALTKQLDQGGIMVIPVGKTFFNQYLIILRKEKNGKLTQERSLPVRFVALKKN